MTATEPTYRQIARALTKVSAKFPSTAECMPLTDIYLQVKQESGELLAFDEDDHELTRCVIEEWIGNKDEDFYEAVRSILIDAIRQVKDVAENIAILKPYSFILMGEDGETIADLYLVDDDTIVLSGELMEGLGNDLDNFWEELSKK